MFVATKRLPRQLFVATNILLSRQAYFCRDRTRLLSRQKYACHDETKSACRNETKYACRAETFVAINTSIIPPTIIIIIMDISMAHDP